MSDVNSVVVVGTGQAGLQLAVSLRTKGFRGSITLIGEEPHLPYQRPPLSKDYLSGKVPLHSVRLRPETFYDSKNIDLRTNESVIAVDRDRKHVTLSSGGTLGYSHLVLATGARPRSMPFACDDASKIFYLRGIADADKLRKHLSGQQRVVVLGGGFIGLELAAVAVSEGHEVTVVESMARLMTRAVSPEVSAHLLAEHSAQGTKILLGRTVVEARGGAEGPATVTLDDGTHIGADVVVVSIGVVPNAEIASDAGLATADGIVVDDRLLTSDPSVSAIGDCARFPCTHVGSRPIRLESVQNAVDQAKYVAGRILGSVDGPYSDTPWFWTHQFGQKVQMVGLAGPDDDRVIIRAPGGRGFSVLHFDGDALTCVESVNSPGEHMAARTIFAGDRRPTPAESSQQSFSLIAFAKQHRTPHASRAPAPT